jgi:NAD(P)-dependent dehydrogenase (short-subunit alcohol dehydrogenase family)
VERLQGRVAIVTGAGQGIGRAIARGFAREGAAVVIAELNREQGQAVEQEIRDLDQEALAIQTDVSDEGSVQRMIDSAMQRFGRLDILVNNAGIYPTSPVEAMAEEEWDRVIGTNLVGGFLCTQAVVPHLIAQRSGRIISVSSGRALEGAQHGAHYAATKAGIIGFIKSLALEVAPYGITANVLLPGVTDTAQPRGHLSEEALYARAAEVPLGRISQPEDLVGPTIFLASDAARFVTGQTVVVNGGAIRW